MTILYNCHTDGDQYRITKFDKLGNVESSYLCSMDECECPAGHRDTCRHRHMLPLFISQDKVNTFWFFNYDSRSWVLNEPAEVEPARSFPEGIQIVNLEDVSAGELHNMIAKAVGEPVIPNPPFRRRV